MFPEGQCRLGKIAMQTTGVSVQIGLSGVGVLAFGWALALLLVLAGRLRGNRALLGGGIVAAGLMILLSPLAVFVYYAARDGAVQMGPGELLVLSGLAFLGGFVASLGVPYFRPTIPSAATPMSGKR